MKRTVEITYDRKKKLFKYDNVQLLDKYVKESLAKLIRAELPETIRAKKTPYDVAITISSKVQYYYKVSVA